MICSTPVFSKRSQKKSSTACLSLLLGTEGEKKYPAQNLPSYLEGTETILKAKEYELNQDGNMASITVRKQWNFSTQKNKQASTQTVWGITGIGNNQACAEVSVLQVKDIKSWAKLTTNSILMTTMDCMYNPTLIGSISLVDRARALLYSSKLISFGLTICEITNIAVKTTNQFHD